MGGGEWQILVLRWGREGQGKRAAANPNGEATSTPDPQRVLTRPDPQPIKCLEKEETQKEEGRGSKKLMVTELALGRAETRWGFDFPCS